jgi:hypothetical protein
MKAPETAQVHLDGYTPGTNYYKQNLAKDGLVSLLKTMSNSNICAASL